MGRARITLIEATTVVTVLAVVVASAYTYSIYIFLPAIVLTVVVLLLRGETITRLIERKAIMLESKYGVYVYGRDKASSLIVLSFMLSSVATLIAIYLGVAPLTAFPVVVSASTLLSFLVIPLALTRVKMLSSMVEGEVPLALLSLKLFSDAATPLPKAIELLESKVLPATSTIVRVCKRLAEVSFHKIEDVFLLRAKTYSRRLYDYVSAMVSEYNATGSFSSTVTSIYRVVWLDMENMLRNLYLLARGVSELIPEVQSTLLAVVGTMFIFYPVSVNEMLLYVVYIPLLVAVVVSAVTQVITPMIVRLRVSTNERIVLTATGIVASIALAYTFTVSQPTPENLCLVGVATSLPSLSLLPRIASLITGKHVNRVKMWLRRLHDDITIGRSVDESLRMLRAEVYDSLSLDVFAEEMAGKIVEHAYQPSSASASLVNIYDAISTRAVQVWRLAWHALLFSMLSLATTIAIYVTGAITQKIVLHYAQFMAGFLISKSFFRGMKYAIAFIPYIAYFTVAACLGYLYALPFLLVASIACFITLHWLGAITSLAASLLLG